ncbi:MAG: putative sterol carrier protein [Polyangiales bacterium]
MTTPSNRLWSRTLADVLIAKINGDDKMKKLARKLEQTIQLRCLDTPDGTDVAARYGFANGKATLVEWVEEPSPAAFRTDTFDKRSLLARTTAPYSIWVKLDKGEMGVIDAILSPHYKFEGQKLKVLKNIRVFHRVNELSSDIEKVY